MQGFYFGLLFALTGVRSICFIKTSITIAGSQSSHVNVNIPRNLTECLHERPENEETVNHKRNQARRHVTATVADARRDVFFNTIESCYSNLLASFKGQFKVNCASFEYVVIP